MINPNDTPNNASDVIDYLTDYDTDDYGDALDNLPNDREVDEFSRWWNNLDREDNEDYTLYE